MIPESTSAPQEEQRRQLRDALQLSCPFNDPFSANARTEVGCDFDVSFSVGNACWRDCWDVRNRRISC